MENSLKWNYLVSYLPNITLNYSVLPYFLYMAPSMFMCIFVDSYVYTELKYSPYCCMHVQLLLYILL